MQGVEACGRDLEPEKSTRERQLGTRERDPV